MPQEITGFLERGVPRQVMDVVAAIRQHAAIAIEKTDPGRSRDDVFESAFGFCFCRHGVDLTAFRRLQARLAGIGHERAPRASLTQRHTFVAGSAATCHETVTDPLSTSELTPFPILDPSAAATGSSTTPPVSA